jgi:hypothetical protein
MVNFSTSKNTGKIGKWGGTLTHLGYKTRQISEFQAG